MARSRRHIFLSTVRTWTPTNRNRELISDRARDEVRRNMSKVTVIHRRQGKVLLQHQGDEVCEYCGALEGRSEFVSVASLSED
jgi:hypothetical protein